MNNNNLHNIPENNAQVRDERINTVETHTTHDAHAIHNETKSWLERNWPLALIGALIILGGLYAIMHNQNTKQVTPPIRTSDSVNTEVVNTPTTTEVTTSGI